MQIFKTILYGAGFFLVTLGIQFFIYKIRRNTTQGKNGIMVGNKAIIAMSIVGLISCNIYFLSAIIGFTIADEIGTAMKWHL